MPTTACASRSRSTPTTLPCTRAAPSPRPTGWFPPCATITFPSSRRWSRSRSASATRWSSRWGRAAWTTSARPNPAARRRRNPSARTSRWLRELACRCRSTTAMHTKTRWRSSASAPARTSASSSTATRGTPPWRSASPNAAGTPPSPAPSPTPRTPTCAPRSRSCRESSSSSRPTPPT